MNRKLIAIAMAMTLISQCFSGALQTVFAASANMCQDGDFEAYTDGDAIPDSPNYNWKYYGNGKNSAIYSSDASYGTGSTLGAKVTYKGAGNCQLNCDMPSLDKSKTYTIEFDEKVTGPVNGETVGQAASYTGRFIMFDSSWGYLFTDGDENNNIFLTPNQWTHYSFTIGPAGSGADHIFSSNVAANGTFMRFGFGQGQQGVLYIDNFSIKEGVTPPAPSPSASTPPSPSAPSESTPTDTSKMIIDGDFERYTNGDPVAQDAQDGYCKFYGTEENSAIYSTDASYGKNGTIGVKMQRGAAGNAAFSCHLPTIDKTKFYVLEFDAMVDGSSWAGRFSILGLPSYERLTVEDEQWLSTTWTHYAYILGPSEADYTFSDVPITGGVEVRFYLADTGTMFIDNFTMKEGNVIQTPPPGGGPTSTPGVSHGNSPTSGFSGKTRSSQENSALNVTVKAPSNIANQTVIFDDIDSVPWAKASIETLYDFGIVSGTSGKKFSPNDTVTREQFVKMLVCTLGFDKEEGDNPFKDIAMSDWSYFYIISAKNHNLISGINDFEFGAKLPITRADMAVVACNAIGTDTSNVKEAEFSDMNEVPDYAKPYVSAISSLGIMQGSNNLFSPKSNATRAQASVLINNIREYLKVQKGR